MPEYTASSTIVATYLPFSGVTAAKNVDELGLPISAKNYSNVIFLTNRSNVKITKVTDSTQFFKEDYKH